MTQTLMTVAVVSAAEAWVLCRPMLKVPAPTDSTVTSVSMSPETLFTITWSVAATKVLVTVNDTRAPAASEVACVVILPVYLLNVTPVVQ